MRINSVTLGKMLSRGMVTVTGDTYVVLSTVLPTLAVSYQSLSS